MTDPRFDTRLERVVGRYADSAVRPIDPVEVALVAIRVGGTQRRERGAIGRSRWLLLAVTVGLLVALIGYALLGGGGPKPNPLTSVRPSSSPAIGSAAPTVPPTAIPGGGPSGGTWLAEIPNGLVVANSPGASRMRLAVTSGPTATIDLSNGPEGLFRSAVTPFGVGDLEFSTDVAGDQVTLNGSSLAQCHVGDQGHYRSNVTGNGLMLTLTVVTEACPARQAILARTWTRLLSVPNGGGVGVVDAFDPLFSVQLPAGTYDTSRSVDEVTLVQAFPELQFLAWKDPQGFRDPCDRSKGRYPIERGPDAFVAYFRQLDGFTVDSTDSLTVDGRPALRLVVHANPDASCPDGQLWEWQPKSEPGDTAWFLSPGETDSLVLVDVPSGTLMFEVLPAPNELESQIVRTIHFLDHLPTQP
jgi:hypothetical protein